MYVFGKHSLIFQDDSITVHIYVKEIRKDSVQVKYEEKLLQVQFQTTYVHDLGVCLCILIILKDNYVDRIEF